MNRGITKSLFLTLTAIFMMLAGKESLLYAQKTNAVDKNKLPSAATLVAKHIEAIGGETALRKLKSIELSGTLENDVLGHTYKADLSTLSVAPDKFRILVQHPQFSMIRAVNGQKAWGWRSASESDQEGETAWLSTEEAQSFQERATFNPELNREKLFKSFETVGLTTIGDREAYEVQVTAHNDETHSRYFDAQSGRLVKIVRNVKSSLGEYRQETMISRYEQFEGVWIPMRLDHKLFIGDSPGTQVHNFSKATINGKTNEKLFEVPAELSDSEHQNAHDTGKAETSGHGHAHDKHDLTKQEQSGENSENDK